MGDGDAAELRRDVVIAGHTGDVERVRAALRHDDATVREAAFGAMARLGLFSTELASTGIGDPHPRVRGRVAELCAELPGFDLGPLLNDDIGGDGGEGLVRHHALQGQALLAHRADDRVLAAFDGLVATLLREPGLDLRAGSR